MTDQPATAARCTHVYPSGRACGLPEHHHNSKARFGTHDFTLLRESMEFAPGHFWTYRETPYESSIQCQCKWGWRWNQPWGGRDMALATYRDHARNETGWTPTEHGQATWQGSSM